MHDKARDVVEGFVAGRVGRRELIRRLAVLGVGVGVAGESLEYFIIYGATPLEVCLQPTFSLKRH